jgi:hypothetical protein
MIEALLLHCEQTEGGHNTLLRVPVLGTRVDTVAMHALERVDLRHYRGLLVTIHADQRYLAARRAQLEAFLAGGGAIVACGQVATPFLEELQPFVPLQDYRLDDLRVNLERPHPVWAGVESDHLTFRRGVAGFYGRGHNALPPGATVINTLGPRRAPVDFVCRPKAGGRLLVHAGNDLWGYVDADNTAARMTPQLLHWIAAGAE